MKPNVSLCRHLRSPELATLPIDADGVLDWQDGPVTAVARCADCGELALLELLEERTGVRPARIYALAGLERESLAVYRRDLARGSCDPRRLEQETAALLSSAGPVERLVALEPDGYRVLGSAAPPEGLK